MTRSGTTATVTEPVARAGTDFASQAPRPVVGPPRSARPRASVTTTRSISGGGFAAEAVGLVRLDDLLHERVPDDVALVEVDRPDALHVCHDLERLDEAGHPARRQVDLRDVAGDDGLRAEAETRQEH